MECQRSGAYEQLGIHIRHYALGKIRCGNAVHGDSYSPAQHAAKESADPFSAVIAPEQYSVPLADVASLKFPGKAECQFRKLAICPTQSPEAATVYIRDFSLSRQVHLRIIG